MSAKNWVYHYLSVYIELYPALPGSFLLAQQGSRIECLTGRAITMGRGLGRLLAACHAFAIVDGRQLDKGPQSRIGGIDTRTQCRLGNRQFGKS